MYIIRVLTSLVLCLAASTVSADDRSLALEMVNKAREAQGVAPLTWNSDLAAYAQFWAVQIGAGAQPFSHAPAQLRPQQGENIYEHQSGQCDAAFDTPLQTAMREWLSQVTLYDGQPLKTGQEHWLHWSQCMWADTTQIGCAQAYSVSDAYKVFNVCRFLPQGNILGEKPF
ncbi:CAP domain-containing protein [Dactylonectria macrodidyma]|uniref:CAP domain-containing protein n=1 Tax=Dactylonectria macrodidyma TaxID=307937 RepID=A0A9P9FQ44_9HYPO|nr:CAP domain-containing protein [Dactylonectria macrodidyma]